MTCRFASHVRFLVCLFVCDAQWMAVLATLTLMMVVFQTLRYQGVAFALAQVWPAAVALGGMILVAGLALRAAIVGRYDWVRGHGAVTEPRCCTDVRTAPACCACFHVVATAVVCCCRQLLTIVRH